MALSWVAAGYLASGVLVLALAVVMLVTSRHAPANRLLGGMLVVEASGGFSGALEQGGFGHWGFVTFMPMMALMAPLYLLVVSRLATPLAAPFRRPLGRAALVVLFAATGALAFVAAREAMVARAVPAADYAPAAALFLILSAVMLFGFVAALDAWRRAPRGTAQRARAGAFALAFGVRDAIFTVFLLAIPVGSALTGSDLTRMTGLRAVPIAGEALFAALLSYGILRTQLFDIDLKVKWGAARGAVVAVVVVAALATAKVAEFYLSKTMGLVVGGVIAGLTLFLAPRLNRIADRVADKAAPAVRPTPDYVDARKAEVYRAAAETAWEGGGITAKDRLILDRLREKLALDAAEAARIESEAARIAAHPVAPAPHTVS